MIQSAMYFALGLLTAGLIGLVVMPAVWRRALRLARTRLEASVPMTRAEIEADKDQLRAGFAVASRKLEMEVERLREKLANEVIEASRRRDEITLLTRNKAALNEAVSGLEEQVAELKGGLATANNKLATAEAEIGGRDARIAEVAAALEALQAKFAESEVMTEELRLELVARGTEIVNLNDRIAAAAAAEAAGTAAREKTMAAAALDRERLVVEQKRGEGLAAGLGALQIERAGRLADLERAANEIRSLNSVLAAERTARAELAAELERARADVAAPDEEGRAAAMAEDNNLRRAIETHEREKAELKKRLAALEADAAALGSENAELRRGAEAEWERQGEETRRLRERLGEIAAGVAKLRAAGATEPAPAKAEPPVPRPAPVAAAEPTEAGPIAERLRTAPGSDTRH